VRALAGWALRRPGGASSSRGSEQGDIGVRQRTVITERAVEQVGGHDRDALQVAAAAVDVGAVNAHQRRHAGAHG
jgi:hypothetical protein